MLLSKVNRPFVEDALKDCKHWKSILNLICAENEDEKIVENLASAVDSLRLCCSTLEAVLCIKKTD